MIPVISTYDYAVPIEYKRCTHTNWSVSQPVYTLSIKQIHNYSDFDVTIIYFRPTDIDRAGKNIF